MSNNVSVSGGSNNGNITVRPSNTTGNATVSTESSSSSVDTVNNAAWHYSEIAKQWAISAKESEEIATAAVETIGTALEDVQGYAESAQGYAESAQESAEYIVNNAPTATIEQTVTGAIVTTIDLTHGTTTAILTNGNGVSGVNKISTVGLVDTYRMAFTNGTYFDYPVKNGANGAGSVADVWVNGTSVLDGDIAKVTVPTNNNQLTNGAGYITGITPSDITTALGYTPYDSSNPSGYTSNVGTVTSVNNVSPVNGDVSLTIPTVNDGTITINQGGTQKGVFTVNQSGNTTINLDGNQRNIGEIVASTIPLTDAGLHLLDGALINGSGSYGAFVDYIAGLVIDYPDLFVTESDWQTAVTTYGVCGKFVYDSVNNTVRLPKVTGIIEGTTDLTALGDLVEAGLPNITGTFNGDYINRNSGAFYTYTSSIIGNGGSGEDAIIGFNASRSSSIYGNSTTVQPQTIKVLYYIVIATSTKTDIQVDIDEIATDLNGKADTDLSNVPNTKAILEESYVNGTSWYRIYSDGWCGQGGIASLSNKGSVSLLKNYINTNYSVQLTQNAAIYDYTYNTAYTKTTSSFKVSVVAGTSGTSGSIAWYAYGYIR